MTQQRQDIVLCAVKKLFRHTRNMFPAMGARRRSMPLWRGGVSRQHDITLGPSPAVAFFAQGYLAGHPNGFVTTKAYPFIPESKTLEIQFPLTPDPWGAVVNSFSCVDHSTWSGCACVWSLVLCLSLNDQVSILLEVRRRCLMRFVYYTSERCKQPIR